MKFRISVCVFVLSLLTVRDSKGVFLNDDKCHIVTVSDLNSDNPKDVVVDIPSSCQSGDIDWHYPKGNLNLTMSFGGNAAKVFCLQESWATMIGGVVDATGGKYQKLAIPTKDKPTCVKSVGGKVKLVLTSEETQYYMTTLKYYVTS